MNRGALVAQQKLREHGAKAALARKLGMRLDRMSRIVSGKLRPTSTERASFEDELGVGWRLWDQPASSTETAA